MKKKKSKSHTLDCWKNFNKKLGSYLLSQAIQKSFNSGVERVWVHTCSLDHKNALNNYIARGMKIFKTEIIRVDQFSTK